MERKTLNVEWVGIEEEKPEEKGFYVVMLAMPYTKPVNNSVGVQYFDGANFERETAGATYLSHWLKGLDKPYISFGEVNKLVKDNK